jgi:AcrR family transcriptional regulator
MSHGIPAKNAGKQIPAAYETKHLELLKAAAGLFARHGYHNTSVRDLARETGRSLSGLYYYFSEKEELLFQIQHHCYGALLDTMDTALREVTDPKERLVTFICRHLAFFRHNMDEMKVLAHEDVTLTGDYGKRILELKRKYTQVLVGILAACEAELPAVTGRPTPEVSALILFGAMNWLYTWPRRVRELPAEQLAGDIAQIFLCGYPGCPETGLNGMQHSILCAPQDFWKDGVPRPGTPRTP